MSCAPRPIPSIRSARWPGSGAVLAVLGFLCLLGLSGAGAAAGLDIVEVRAGSLEGRPALAVELASARPLSGAALAVAADPPIAFGPAQVTLDRSGRGALVLLPLPPEPRDRDGLAGGPSMRLDGREIALTVSDVTESSTIRALVRPGNAERTTWQNLGTGLGMLGLAFLGGLILNLMPCVLPLLALKLFAALRLGGQAPGAVRAGFLATAAGILASFLLLAFAIVLLRRAGSLIGWGIQFQEPAFVAMLAAVTMLFSANLWGLFELRLPRAVTDRLGSPAREGLAGHFATGFLATLLATPCSAPFLGTAVGFALTRSGPVILAVFLALGLGLATPYLAVAAYPRAAAWLPRPGAWMVQLRRILGLALVGTVLWLLWVLSGQIGPGAAGAIGGLLAGSVLLLALRPRMTGLGRKLASAGFAGLVLIIVALPILAERQGSAADEGAVAWRRFDRGDLRRRVAEGHVVLVDVGARWCPTCRLNERLVLDRAPVADRLSGDVLPVRADWTLADPAVSAFLASYGRFGVPFTIVYGPHAPHGLPLPEILTADAVLDAVALAGRSRNAASGDHPAR